MQLCNNIVIRKNFFQSMIVTLVIKVYLEFFQVTYRPKTFSFIMFNSDLDCYWARRSSNNQIQILYEIKDLDENWTSGSSTDSNR